MASAGGSVTPRKPWENARSASSGPSPFRPASESTNTAAVVEAAGVADSGDNKNSTQNGAIVGRPPMPIRSYGGTGYNYNQYNNSYGINPSYGGTYNNGYNSYNRGYGMGGGMYGGGYGVGNSYTGGMYGSHYGSGMYGNGMYGSSYGMGMGGMGMGMGMGPMGMPGQGTSNGLGDPNIPYDDNQPPGTPSFWFLTLQKMHWMMVVFGNIVSLISENTQTFHIMVSALYTFLDRSGMLAGFVLKLLRMWSRPRLQPKASNPALMGPKNTSLLQLEGPSNAGGGGAWDNVWSSQSAG